MFFKLKGITCFIQKIFHFIIFIPINNKDDVLPIVIRNSVRIHVSIINMQGGANVISRLT
jgi:hypothetical protein